jgi:Fic family protein
MDQLVPECLDRAFAGAQTILASVLRKARFWDVHAAAALNERQRLIINRLLGGFEGKLTSSRYAALAKCSQDTAARDIEDLSDRAFLPAIRPADAAPATLSSPAPPTRWMRWLAGFWPILIWR